MNKLFLTIILLGLIFSALSGVDDTTKKKFDQTPVIKARQIEIVKFEPLKPDIERYQKKTATYQSTGFFQMYKNDIRNTNKVLLKKWIKESK